MILVQTIVRKTRAGKIHYGIKIFLKGKCFRKQSHRNSPFKFADEDGERVNRRAVLSSP